MISRGVPRIAKAHIGWLNDFAISNRSNGLRIDSVTYAMSLKGIDSEGYTEQDRRYISLLKRVNKPVGVSTICASLNLDKDTVENVIEPWLLSQGVIIKTSKGRQIV
jgi:Holliday junction DNA helicase RuvB